jgi:hypothetical protein
VVSLVGTASLAYAADNISVDGDIVKVNNNLTYAPSGAPARPCADRGTAVNGVVTVNFNGGGASHYSASEPLTITYTPPNSDITVTNGAVTSVPANWNDNTDTFTIPFTTTVKPVADAPTLYDGSYTVEVSVVGNNSHYDPGAVSYDVVLNCGNSAPSNHAPTVSSAAADADGTEGDTLSTGGTFADEDDDTLTLTADNTDGTFTDDGDGTWTWSMATTDDVVGGDITVTANDGNGGTITDTFHYSAVNADPSIDTFSVTKTTGCSVNLTATFSDSGSADTHTGDVDWGDASGTNSDGEEDLGTLTSPISQGHTYPGSGSYTVSLTVTDDDGGSDTETSGSPVVFTDVISPFLDPIRADGNYKIGSTLPIKVTITDCNGVANTGLHPTVALTKVNNAVDGDPTLPADTTAAPTNGKQMFWAGDHYHYNLSTKNSEFAANNGALTAGTYRLTVSSSGLDSRSICIELRK